MLDRETTIQQKPAAQRANIPIDLQIQCRHNFTILPRSGRGLFPGRRLPPGEKFILTL